MYHLQTVAVRRQFILVGMHIDAVCQWREVQKIPPEVKQLSAFFRVWCLVEMAAALNAKKTVVLLVGAAAQGDEIRFEPNKEMLGKLWIMMNIEQAEASVPEDKERILGDIRRGVGVSAVNTLARGAVTGAMHSVTEKEVLQAALGNARPLAALKGRKRLSRALLAAAAGCWRRSSRCWGGAGRWGWGSGWTIRTIVCVSRRSIWPQLVGMWRRSSCFCARGRRWASRIRAEEIHRCTGPHKAAMRRRSRRCCGEGRGEGRSWRQRILRGRRRFTSLLLAEISPR